MDLFGDLPAPTSEKAVETATTKAAPASSLFDDLPEVQQTSCSTKRKAEDAGQNGTKKSSIEIYGLEGHYAERQGEREEMQDAHVILDDLRPHLPQIHPSMVPDVTIRKKSAEQELSLQLKPPFMSTRLRHRLAYYAVFDGHAGARAAQYCATHLHQSLTAAFPKGNITQVESEIKRCFVDTMKKTDEDFLKLASKQKPAWKDGTTVVCVLAINNVLYIANLGDSKAILCRRQQSSGDLCAIPLSKDHSPTSYDERMRIQKAGGNVKDGRVMGVVEVSRSIGDGPYKRLGLTCVPDVKRCQLTANDRFLLIACDGLWKSFSNESAVQFISEVLEESHGEDSVWDVACSRIANEAVRKLSADNVTVIVVPIISPDSKPT